MKTNQQSNSITKNLIFGNGGKNNCFFFFFMTKKNIVYCNFAKQRLMGEGAPRRNLTVILSSSGQRQFIVLGIFSINYSTAFDFSSEEASLRKLQKLEPCRGMNFRNDEEAAEAMEPMSREDS